MAVAFKREAETVLRQGGYQFDRTSGKQHAVWTHPDKTRPPIVLPGTPRNPDHALVRIRRAVRLGTTPHIPTGLESDMPSSTSTPKTRPLKAEYLDAAPKALHQRVTEAKRTGKKPRLVPGEVEKWLRKLLVAGRIENAPFREAYEELLIGDAVVSHTRIGMGCVSYREADNKGNNAPTFTDYRNRAPKDASVVGNYGKGISKKSVMIHAQAPEEPTPTVPGTVRGAVQAAFKDFAGPDAAGMAARLGAREPVSVAKGVPDFIGGEVVTQSYETNGNGHPPQSELEAAMELLRQAALNETRGLTGEDVMLLRGYQDTCRRLRDDLDGLVGGIGRLLNRVEA